MPDEKRQERRIPIDSVVLPFLGSRASDYQPFQYLLQDVSPNGVCIALPRWAVSRERLRQGERIHFHIPFRLGSVILESGKVVWERWDAPQEAQIVGASLDQAASVHFPVFITISSSQFTIDLGGFETPAAIFCQVLRDSLFLKRGVLIYLRHLTAYFSRTGEFKKGEYTMFREAMLDDVKHQVEINAARLEQWHSECASQHPHGGNAIPDLDMEEVRGAMEPEMYLDLFRSALGVGNARMYLQAIKELEKRLFYNYNTMVMLFIQTLQAP